MLRREAATGYDPAMGDQPAAGSAPAWPLTPNFPADLFQGMARFYAQYRPPYPQELLDDLRTRAGVSGDGRLLDLACGTGELALSLHSHFREVWAVDLEPEMVDVGREKAERCGTTNVRWMVGRAEDVDAELNSFELITAGNAFHRLDRRLVAQRAGGWVAPGRCLAVVGSSSVWSGTAEWQAIAVEVIHQWTDHEGRLGQPVPAQASDQPRQTHEEVLRDAGFDEVAEYRFPTPHSWTLDSFIGYLRSTSVSSKITREGSTEAFEAELRQRLLCYDPGGQYPETIDFYYVLARRPRAR